MARGTSQSQSSTSANTPPTGTVEPRGPAAATAKMRCQGSAVAEAKVDEEEVLEASAVQNGSNMLRFYTNDAPGLKITLIVVLVMSVCFIGFVTVLHVFGKPYRYRSGVAF